MKKFLNIIWNERTVAANKISSLVSWADHFKQAFRPTNSLLMWEDAC